MSPEEPTPCAWATLVANSREAKIHARKLIDFIKSPSGCVMFRARLNTSDIEFECNPGEAPRRDVDLTLDLGMGEDIAKLALTVPKDAPGSTHRATPTLANSPRPTCLFLLTLAIRFEP